MRSSPFGYAQGKLCYVPQDDVVENVIASEAFNVIASVAWQSLQDDVKVNVP